MDPNFRRLRERFRRRLAAIPEALKRLLAALKPQDREFASQRMCPFCGLITPRSKAFCLECGKSFSGNRLARQDAR